ncbi:flagellar protein FlbD [bacterium]|nr:MAG: flagellar protein FlbD [bacterium]
MIAVQKLDGSRIYLNEDLIERVEDGADGQSAVYLINGGHIIVANDSNVVIERIRAEKVSQLRRVHHGPQQSKAAPAHVMAADVPILTQVKEQ